MIHADWIRIPLVSRELGFGKVHRRLRLLFLVYVLLHIHIPVVLFSTVSVTILNLSTYVATRVAYDP